MEGWTVGRVQEFAPTGEFGALENRIDRGGPQKEIEHLKHVHPLSGAFKLGV